MEEIIKFLPAVNAILISTSGLFIIRGVLAIKRGDQRTHQQSMMTATVLAVIFLFFYVTRMALGGMVPFDGPQIVRTIYYVILAPHVTLALVQTPLVVLVLYHAYKKNFTAHRRLARFTYPIWIFVSFSGVFVYGLLHYPY